ncbi:2OG-Fe(II) oxygenase [Candidatus Woesearchaeota archaeon]|nr:2OG-Fe(II) oxygenase [Candidatus Woesearchaeota archaeon]
MHDWVNQKYLKSKEVLRLKFSKAKPFAHLVLADFFSKRLVQVQNALLREEFSEQNSDLFQFRQTKDIKLCEDALLREFHSFFSSPSFIKFIADITGETLHSIDMSGFIYGDTDYLLPHDDRLEGRKVAYVVQMSSGFTKRDGGALQFFDKNKVVKSFIPSFGALCLFKVSAKSVHQVQEILSDKKRVTFAGWFHG